MHHKDGKDQRIWSGRPHCDSIGTKFTSCLICMYMYSYPMPLTYSYTRYRGGSQHIRTETCVVSSGQMFHGLGEQETEGDGLFAQTACVIRYMPCIAEILTR